jgi:TIR domain
MDWKKTGRPYTDVAMADVFISNSHEDSAVAERVESEIRRDTALTVWRDVRIGPGVKFEGSIQEELRRACVCLVLMSRASLASEYCQNEVGFAEANGMSIVPVRLDDCRPTGFLATRSYIDFSRAYGFPGGRPSPRRLTDVLCDEVRAHTQNGLRADYLEMYRHLLSWLRKGAGHRVVAAVVAKPHSLEEDHYSRSEHRVWRATARKFCAAVIDYLERGGSCLSLLPVENGGNHLPVWFFRRADLDREESVRLSILPDAVLLLESPFFDDGAVIDAAVFTPVVSDDRTRSQRDVPFPVDIEYVDLHADVASELRWVAKDGAENLYAFVLSKGVYRVAQGRQYGSRLTLTKYLSIQSARLRLFAGDRDAASRAVSDTLQLMYVGFHKSYNGGGLQFFLFNDRKGIAVVSAIHVVVHAVTQRDPEPRPGPGASMREYKYFVELRPTVGHVAVTEDKFKYGASDIDMFSIELGSDEWGYDYVFNIEVTWIDMQSGATHTLATPRETVAFPRYKDQGFGD